MDINLVINIIMTLVAVGSLVTLVYEKRRTVGPQVEQTEADTARSLVRSALELKDEYEEKSDQLNKQIGELKAWYEAKIEALREENERKFKMMQHQLNLRVAELEEEVHRLDRENREQKERLKYYEDNGAPAPKPNS